MMSCMLCNNAKAAVYCYNDNAYLCKACDGQIHNKNKLAWRHQRSHLCEVCDSVPPKPAVVYCAQDKAYLCAACDANVHAANSIVSTHERTAVSIFTEEGVSGGRGAPEHSGEDDGLFADLIAGGGDAFAGLPEMDGAGFLVDDPNDANDANDANAAHGTKREARAHGVPVEPGHPSSRREDSPRDDARAGRDSAGSAAGRKADGESSAGAAGSGSDASHSLVRGETPSASGVDAPHRVLSPQPPRGSLAASGARAFGLTMNDYASLERVGASGVDDFLGPIMDDHASVGFEDADATGAAWNPHAVPSSGVGPGAFAAATRNGGASEAAVAQAAARARAMQHARAQGVGAPSVGAPGGMGPAGAGAMQGGMGAELGLGGVGGSMPGGGSGPSGPGPVAPRGAPPGTHGMPPPPFGMGPPPPGAPAVRGPNGMLYFSSPPLPMLHLTNGASDAPPSRLERLRRWKEKRKNRNFNKTIRYQSRKVCADNRPRIKGKFVKVGSTPDLGAMDDLGADFERAQTAGGPGGTSLGGVPEHETSADDSVESGGASAEGRLARVGGLRRRGGLTNSMSVPAGLAMMGAKEETSA